MTTTAIKQRRPQAAPKLPWGSPAVYFVAIVVITIILFVALRRIRLKQLVLVLDALGKIDGRRGNRRRDRHCRTPQRFLQLPCHVGQDHRVGALPIRCGRLGSAGHRGFDGRRRRSRRLGLAHRVNGR